jgi:hypothetical protein
LKNTPAKARRHILQIAVGIVTIRQQRNCAENFIAAKRFDLQRPFKLSPDAASRRNHWVVRCAGISNRFASAAIIRKNPAHNFPAKTGK